MWDKYINEGVCVCVCVPPWMQGFMVAQHPPLRACFLVVLRQQWPRPGMGLMSLLLTGGGCSTSLGGRVRQTGSAAALIRIPVMPASAGCTGLEPFRFFTGTVGTLQQKTRQLCYQKLRGIIDYLDLRLWIAHVQKTCAQTWKQTILTSHKRDADTSLQASRPINIQCIWNKPIYIIKT